jgi:hypothetical protein
VIVILVGAPRSGAGLLASLLASSPNWGTTALSTGQPVDSVLRLEDRDFASHRLTAEDLTPEVVDVVRQAASTISSGVSVNTVDWNPRWSMRIALLARSLPGARFVLMSHPSPTCPSGGVSRGRFHSWTGGAT